VENPFALPCHSPKSDIKILVEVLKFVSKYRKKSIGKGHRGGGGTWAGLKQEQES